MQNLKMNMNYFLLPGSENIGKVELEAQVPPARLGREEKGYAQAGLRRQVAESSNSQGKQFSSLQILTLPQAWCQEFYVHFCVIYSSQP
jgi:hypothetical protein